VSTSEWIASDSIAALPEIADAMNLTIAMARLPIVAAMTAVFDSPAMPHVLVRARLHLNSPRRFISPATAVSAIAQMASGANASAGTPLTSHAAPASTAISTAPL